MTERANRPSRTCCSGETFRKFEAAVGHPRGMSSGSISGKRVHEMMLIHASNTGPEGLDYLASELDHETDPLRRIDLLWAISSQRTDGARRHLHEFLAQEDNSLYEVLFAADNLARLGPSQDVAPVLKRICYRIEDNDVRLAMRCLLWKWY